MKLNFQRSRSFIDLRRSHSDLIFLNFFSSITAWPIEAKFPLNPPWDKGTKAYSNGHGHMIEVCRHAHIRITPLNIFFSGTERPMILKIDMQY